MSTLSVTTVTTGNATTDFTLSTGNTNAADVVIFSNGYGIMLSGNSTSNTFYLVSNGNIGIGNSAPDKLLVVSANAGAASATFNGGNTLLRLSGNSSAYSEPALEFGEQALSPTAKIASKNETNGGGSLYFITRDTTSTSSALTARMRITGTGNVVITSNTLTLGTSTAASNGYTFLPNGLKMVWGMVAAANTAAGTFATYASAFTTATYVVQVSHQGNARTVAPLVVNSNTTGANISSGIAATTGTNVYFVAIGI